MLKREISAAVLAAAKKYPVLTITGPRQSGKSTLCRQLFKGKSYANLEDPEQRRFALDDPKGFLAQFPEGAVIDEVQRAPELVSFIQVDVDGRRQKGRFILTGSQQLELSQTVSQSLAGRTALFKLLPFSFSELKAARKDQGSLDTFIHRGFYPRIYDQKLEPTEAMSNYVETYLERDVRQLIQVKDLAMFQRFLRICAGRVGQLVNLQSIASDVGVSHPTIQSWLSTLQASFIIFLLEPFHSNLNKRLVKSPKLYFYDVGLASYLLRVKNASQVSTHPLKGALFENLVIAEYQKLRFHRKWNADLSFFRDKEGHEVDLIIESDQGLDAIEVKAAATFTPEFVRGLRYFKSKFPKKTTGLKVVYDRDQKTQRVFDDVALCSPKELAAHDPS